MSESNPTGMMTPQTVTEPMRPVQLGPPKFATVVSQSSAITPMQVATGVDESQGKNAARYPTAEMRDRNVSDRQRQKVEKEHEEIAGFAVSVFGVGGHASRALVEKAGLRESVGNRHRAQGRHDPRQQRDRADLCHVRRQHDDPRPIMFTATMNVSWTRFIFFWLLFASASSQRSSANSLANDVGVELDAAVYPFLEHALHFVVEAGEAIEQLLEGEEVVEHRLRPSSHRSPGTTTPMPGG